MSRAASAARRSARVGVAVSKDRDDARKRLLARVASRRAAAPRPQARARVAELRDGEDARHVGAATARGWRWAIDARVAQRAARLRDGDREAGAVYLPERLHAVRIAVKKLRYAVELGGRRVAATAATPTLRALKRGQELLGRMHDLQMLIDRVRAGAGVARRRPTSLSGATSTRVVDCARGQTAAACTRATCAAATRSRCDRLADRPRAAQTAAASAPRRGARRLIDGRTLRAVPDSPRRRRRARRRLARRRQAAADRRGDGAHAEGGARPRAARRLRSTSMLTSPLVRARQTAEIVAAAFDPRPPIVTIESLAPGGSYAAVIAELEKQARRRASRWSATSRASASSPRG